VVPTDVADSRNRMLEAVVMTITVVGVILGQLTPCDSVGVQFGHALTQNSLWILVLLAMAARPIRYGTHSGRLASPIGLAILAWLVWIAIAALQVSGHANMRYAINVFWQYTSVMIVLVAARDMGRNPQLRRWCVGLVLVLAWMASMHGLYQYVYSMPQMRANYAKDPEGELAKANIVAPPGSTERMQYENRIASTEPLGPYALTNSLAGFLVVGLILAIGLAFDARPTDAGNTHRWIAAWLILGLLLCLGLTKSRSAWLATIVALAAYLGTQPAFQRWWWPYRFRMAILAPSLIGLVAVAIYLVDPLILWEAPKSLSFRWQYWQASWAMLVDHPWSGVGLGNFQEYYPTYKLAEASEIIADPHNFVLELATTAGIPAVVLLAILGVVVYRKGSASSSHPHNLRLQEARTRWWRADQGWIVGAASAIAAAILWLMPGDLGPTPEGVPYWLSAPVAGLILWWIERHAAIACPWWQGRTLVCASLGMVIHWLASGGWMIPGNAHAVALLLGMATTSPAASPAIATAPSVASDPERQSPGGLATLPLLLALMVMMAFLVTAWRPVQTAAQWQMILKDSDGDSALAAALRASASDPWDPQPQWELVRLRMARLLPGRTVRTDPGELASLQAARSLLLARNPQSWSLRNEMGVLALVQAQADRSAETLRLAVRFFEDAIQRNPTSSALHVQWGAALWLSGDPDGASKAVERAVILDQQNPHLDRKLSKSATFFPSLGAPPPQELRGRGLPESGEGWYTSELVAEFLRNRTGAEG
jgi:hypothetical protein